MATKRAQKNPKVLNRIGEKNIRALIQGEAIQINGNKYELDNNGNLVQVKKNENQS